MPSGRRAFVGVAKQTAFATAVAATDYHRFRGGEAVRTEIEEVTPPNILGVFDEGPTYQGLKTHGGDIPFDGHPNILGLYLLSALGTETVVVDEAGVRWTHTFAPRQADFEDACSLQPLTFEIGRDLTQSFQYVGGVVNRLRLHFGIDEKVLLVTASIMARTMNRITATTPTLEVTQAFRWNQAVITFPDPTAFTTMRSLTVTIENNQEQIAYIDGTQEAAHLRSGNNSRVVAVEGIMRGNTSEFSEFISGSQRYLKSVFTGPVLGTNFYMLTLNFPLFRYLAKDLGVAGPGEIFVGFRGKAKYDGATSNTPMQAILRNAHAAY